MKFSINSLQKIDEQKFNDFYQSFFQKLSALSDEIRQDDVLCRYNEYVENPKCVTEKVKAIEDIYSTLSAGIQVGSGNQSLFLEILNSMVESWNQTIN